VCDRVQPKPAGLSEHLGGLRRPVPDLGGIQSDADYLAEERLGLRQC
jgi:hypothetical protein